MTSYEGLTFSLYVKRQTYNQEWFHDLFRHLWKHGLQFGLEPSKQTLEGNKWETELESPTKILSKRGSQTLPLEQGIELLTSGTPHTICFWDKRVEMSL